MKKSNFVAMILGTIGTVFFALGMCMSLLPEWDTPPYPLQALLPSGRFVPARVRALVDFLVAKFDGLPQE